MSLLKIKTVQTNAIKITFECLKNILPEVNMLINKDYIKLNATNASKTIFVFMKLDSEKFEDYELKNKKEPINIGINMINLYKPIKTIVNNDILTLLLDDKNKLKLQIENSEKDKLFKYELNLIEQNNETVNLRDIDYETCVTMPSSEFQKVCKDFSSLEIENIDIISIKNKIIFQGETDVGKSSVIFGDRENGIICNNISKSDNIIQGTFNLKYLELFTKCTNLCSTIQIYLGNDKPLTINFNVGSLGQLKFVLSPKIKN